VDLTTITVAQFKARFYRDFKYATVTPGVEQAIPDPNFVQDQDIDNAFLDAQTQLNQGLFGTDPQITAAYLYLTAHCLCLIIRQANAGIDSPAEMPVASRAVGSVNETYQIPDAYKNSPILAQYATTAYGLKYLGLALPAMVGNMQAVWGGTNP